MKPPFPKEHGVWAMLFTSLVIGTAVAGSVNLTVLLTSFGLVFLLAAKAPLGAWLRSPDKRNAAWFMGYAVTGGLLLVPVLSRGGLFLVLFSIAIMVPAIPWYIHGLRQRREMKIRYELPAMTLLALASPYAYVSAGGSGRHLMLGMWACILLFYVASSFRVRCSPKSRTLRTGLVYDLAVLTLIFASVVAGTASPWLLAAFAPLLEDIVRAIHPRKENIAFLGRLELAKTLLFACLLVLALHA